MTAELQSCLCHVGAIAGMLLVLLGGWLSFSPCRFWSGLKTRHAAALGALFPGEGLPHTKRGKLRFGAALFAVALAALQCAVRFLNASRPPIRPFAAFIHTAMIFVKNMTSFCIKCLQCQSRHGKIVFADSR